MNRSFSLANLITNGEQDRLQAAHPHHAEGLEQAEALQEIGRDGEDFFDRRAGEGVSEDADEAFDGRGFWGNVGIDLHLAVCDLDPEENRRLAFVDAMLAAVLLGLKARRQRRQPLGEFQQQLQPLARLEAGEFVDDAIELGGGGGHKYPEGVPASSPGLTAAGGLPWVGWHEVHISNPIGVASASEQIVATPLG